MKRALTHNDIEAAVYGGAILGGGGGGHISAALSTARGAVDVGTPYLWSADEFDEEDITATLCLVGAPAAPDLHVTPRHQMRALELLQERLPSGKRLSAVNTNENGSQTTVNAWIPAALTGLPVIDFACNGRAHPTGVMGAMGLHTLENYATIQTFAGGNPEHYLEGAVSGHLPGTSSLISRAAEYAGGGVAVARNPVSIGYAIENGAPGAISHAIELGHEYLKGGIDAAAAYLGGRIVAQGTVRDYRCVQNNGVDVGFLSLDDAAGTSMHFINEYLVLDHDGQRVAKFPDLITTFDEGGTPVPSASVKVGQRLSILLAPAASLTLSPTMFMPDLYEPLETTLGFSFGPTAVESLVRG